MARHIKLAELIPPPEKPDTIDFGDGVEWLLPTLGVDQMAQLLMVEEEMNEAQAFEQLRAQKYILLDQLRVANPGKEVPNYDLTIEQIMELVAVFCGSEGGAIQAVRDALAKDFDEDEDATDEEAKRAARELAEEAGLRDEEDDGPLASPTPSRKRSSRSGTSGNGGRSGGKASAGRSSSRTSKKSSAKTGA